MARLVFLGTPEVAVEPLRTLVRAGHEVALVVTRPDKRRGRGSDLVPSPVKAAATELGLPVSDSLDDAVVARFDSALQAFSTSARDFSEFNAHLKDNVQRMSLSFGDLSDTIKGQVVALRGQPRPARENGQ